MPSLILNQQSSKRQSGFTLLELVLVMLIIGLVASTPLVFIDNQDNQLRYDETLDKMELLRKSILMQSSYRNQPVLSGFVIDNGVLPPASATLSQDPTELQPLISKGDWSEESGKNWADFDALEPHINLGGPSVDASNYPQLKGYRGHYLNSGLDSNKEFLDGWGIAFEIRNDADTYDFVFKGDDGLHPSAYGSVVSGAIKPSDWQVPLNQLDISVVDNSGTSLVLAVVVFENKAKDDAERWTTYHFDIGASQAEHSLSFTASEWKKNGGGGLNTSTEKLPIGQHAVFLINGTSIQIYDRLLVIPNTTQPALQFEVN
ncbi:type II secretion system protein [Neptuniibacter sp. QD72_48]|uniref:type II secretion system protein n=1 Tax=Neptuniibacter sp. QD72_48 TaxID=3398214 RepID=UPI0039F56723